ncbi:peptidylprolyl isomerase [Terrilactibacillus sp. BCM23-1]|uniref:Foldase protein PrsA n=1 Tax=Terrilactibacillus tamarindi TaxID=2599694 RepID=A0A6N8CKY5_9BACI|nr:peptidylprolyl isomerase [Terrilactibacillus tamarindi]MTT30479.1 peptidylprolyl isomerase [Terrilactibacillus tamarindi]
MKKLIIILAAVIGLSSLAACGNNDTIVSTNAGNVSKDDLYNEMKDTYGKQVLQQMVYDKILSKHYKVTKKEIDAKINEIKKSVGSDEQFQLALQQNGLTEKQFRDNVRQQLLLTKAETDGVKVSDKEAKDYYNKNKDQLKQIKASHILVKDKKTADSIEKQLKEGKKFSDLAKKYGTDATKDKGGDLGWFKKGAMDADFEKAAFKLKVNEVSSPVKTQFGYHVIKLTGVKDSYNDLKSAAVDAVKQSKSKSQEQVLQSLIKKSDVDVKDKSFKGLFDSPATSTSTGE